MTKGVSFCNPGTNAAPATEIVWTQDCGILPVLEEGVRVVGIVTDRDLFIASFTQNRALLNSRWVRSSSGARYLRDRRRRAERYEGHGGTTNTPFTRIRRVGNVKGNPVHE
jgi:hypothetical protein